jgi:hypothetical protein
MNENDFDIFKYNLSNAFKYLQSNERIYSINTYYYIDFFSFNIPMFLREEAFNFLLKHMTANHLSENISSSVTNWIF